MKLLDFIKLHNGGSLCSICGDCIKAEHSSPSCCDHTFHVDCLKDWVETHKRDSQANCPIESCGRTFTAISVRKVIGGAVVQNISLAVETQCPICCEDIQPPVATPESCNHHFCFSCLNEWAKIRHECPLDRGPFELILISTSIGGPIVERRFAPPAYQPPPEVEDTTACEICHSQEDEENLLLCDGCDRGYHTYCLRPPLSSIPEGDWFCPECEHGSPTATLQLPSPPPRQRSRQRAAVRRLSRSTRFADNSAEEVNEDESSSSEVENGLHSYAGYLSTSAQRHLSRIAERRHRGTGLLRDLIEQLMDRAEIEQTQRLRRRRNLANRRHRRLRVQETPDSPPVTSLHSHFIRQQQSTQSPVSQLAPNSAASNGHPPTPVQRKRRRISDSSSSDASANSSNSHTVDHRQRRRVRLLSNDVESPPANQATVSSTSSAASTNHLGAEYSPSTGQAPSLGFSRPSATDEDAFVSGNSRAPRPQLQESVSGDENAEPDIGHCHHHQQERQSSTSSLSPPAANTSQQDLFASFADDPVLTSIVDDIHAIASTSSKVAKKGKKKKKTKTKTKKTTSGGKSKKKTVKNVARLRRKKLKLSAAQKRVREAASHLSSPTSSLQSTPRSSTNRQHGSHHSEERKGPLPPLSIVGAGNFCGLLPEPDEKPPLNSETPQTSSTVASSTNFQRPSTGLLSRLEASQSSLFSFSTRNMHVNADNSVSPVKPSARPSSKPQSIINSGVSSNLPSQCRDQTNPSQQQQQQTSAQAHQVNGDVTWSAEATQQVRTLLRDYIAQRHVNAVNQETAGKICQRALSKITAKPANKVPEAKMKKLVDDYVEFYRRNTHH
ncbi:PHD and RING finger domain-containing protein 1 [Sparganum proliferum]